jgi:DNA modification methylase
MELVEFQGNLKSLSQQNYERLKRSILDLGFSDPFNVWKDPKDGLWKVLSGTQRLRTIKKMISEGYKCETVPCNLVEAKDKKEAKRKLLAAAATYGSLESQGLYEFMTEAEIELDELVQDFNFPEIDFPDFQEEFFTDTKTDDPEEDIVPETPEIPCTKIGDIFILGNHRLMCGDSTLLENVEKLMDGQKADLWLTDPPYGVGMQAREESSTTWVNKDRASSKITNDDSSIEEMAILWKSSAKSAHHFTTSKASYYWFACQGGDQMMMMMMLGEAGWQVKHELIWVKDQMCFGRADYHYKHEPIIYGWKRKCSHEWFGDRTQVSTFEIPRPKKSDLHPTMKPIELIERLLKNSSQSNHNILDLFGGSGSTLIACEKTNRKCFMMEIDPHYCDVILDRWSEYTGHDPVREDGTQWSDIKGAQS